MFLTIFDIGHFVSIESIFNVYSSITDQGVEVVLCESFVAAVKVRDVEFKPFTKLLTQILLCSTILFSNVSQNFEYGISVIRGKYIFSFHA